MSSDILQLPLVPSISRLILFSTHSNLPRLVSRPVRVSVLFLTMAAATSRTQVTSPFLTRLTSIFSVQNFALVVGLLSVGGSALQWVKEYVFNYLLTRYLISETISSSENRIILETYIKSICRDEHGDVRVRGDDEKSKVSEATKEEEDVLAYDKDKFDLKVSHLPPIVSKFVHSTAEAMFFRVIDPSDNTGELGCQMDVLDSSGSVRAAVSSRRDVILQSLSEYIVVVGSDDSLVNLFVPSMLRDALYKLWQKTVRRWLIQTLSAEMYQNIAAIFNGGKKDDNSVITLYALRSSAKRLRLFFQEAERFHRQSKTKALYIRDMLYSQNFKAQPRPMSTIAVEPGSGLDLLKEDVERFWTQRTRLESNDLPFQRVHLLHGPPGNGKSSILQALAIQYEIPYFFLDANAVGTAETLRNLLTRYTTSDRCLVVVEDAESAMPKPDEYTKRGSSGGRPGAASGSTGDGGGASSSAQQRSTTSSSTTGGGGNDDDDDDDDDETDKISVKDFIELINGSQSPRPAGRLICLTTNTPEALPAEVLQLVHSQGNMFEFPNAGVSLFFVVYVSFCFAHIFINVCLNVIHLSLFFVHFLIHLHLLFFSERR